MKTLYSRIPADAVKFEIDGNHYANIPHRISMHSRGVDIVEDYTKPRMVSAKDVFIKGGEAYIYFAKIGDSIEITSAIPFGVTVI